MSLFIALAAFMTLAAIAWIVLPLLRPAGDGDGRCLVLGRLAQTLDGRIATACGAAGLRAGASAPTRFRTRASSTR